MTRPAPTPSPASSSAPGSRRGWVAALLVLALLLRLAVALRPPAEVDDLAIPDDAYLSLTIARNIAAGSGPLYGTAPTNGFQPLYVFLAAPLFRIWPQDPDPPVRAALVMLALADVAGLALVLRLVRRSSSSAAATLAAAAVWACDPYSIGTSVNGLETSLAFLFLAGALDRAARGRLEPGLTSRRSHALALGAWLGLAGLARLDSLLLAPIALLALARDARRDGLPGPRVARVLAVAAAAIAVALAPWIAYSLATAHAAFPVSGEAVRYLELSTVGHRPTLSNHYGPMLQQAVGAVARKNVVRLGVIAGLAVLLGATAGRAAWGAARRRLSVHADAVSFATVLVVAYATVVFGHWHFPRYFYPVALALTLVVAALVDLHARRPGRSGPRIAAAAVLALALGSMALPAFARLFRPPTGTWGYRRIGTWADARFPAGTVIGGTQTGALGYFAPRLTVVNLDGVVNRACLEALRAGRAWDYVIQERIEWLVWQDDIAFLDRESGRGSPPRLEPAGEIAGFTTWGAPWWLWRVKRPAEP